MGDGGMVDGGLSLQSLTASDLEVAKGGTSRLEVTGHFSDGSEAVVDTGLSFTSFDEAIATATDGIVSGVAPGSTTIRASMSGVHVDVTVTVLDAFALLRDVSDFFMPDGWIPDFGFASPDPVSIVIGIADATDPVYEGTKSHAITFPGNQQWGGIYLNFKNPNPNPAVPDTVLLPQDLSAFEGGNLVLRIASEPALGNVNVKLEWTGGAIELPLSGYTPTSDDSAFLTYVIPLADFTGIDLSQMRTPFALFNAKAPVVVVPDAGPGTPEPYAGTIYLDDVYYVAPTP